MQCLYPVTIKDPHPLRTDLKFHRQSGYIVVPCGKCIACRVNKSKEWSTRLLYEVEKYSDCSQFVTLTYNDDNLPADFGLHKDELQRYFKRLRKHISMTPELKGTKIKYFACGEYGDNFGRPHYHFILFGLPTKYLHFISDSWQYGFVKIGSVNVKSINYVTGYVMKKYGGDKALDLYGNRQPPFQLQSKGLGLDIFKEKEYERAQERGYITVNGIRRSIPRYYVKKLDIELHSNKMMDLTTLQEQLTVEAKYKDKKRGKL